MRKLALDDDILLNIEKPARYIGGEVNAVMKEKELEAGEVLGDERNALFDDVLR